MIIKSVKAWETVTISKAKDLGYNVLLDQKRLRTELGNLVKVSEKLALSIADEWRSERDLDVLKQKFYTRFCFSVFDYTKRFRLKILQIITEYADCDLVCYLVENPVNIQEKQRKVFSNYIMWAERSLAINLRVGSGIKHIKQDNRNKQKILRYLKKLNDFELTIIYELTKLTGSFFIAGAVFSRQVRTKDAWLASIIEDTYRIEEWGEVEEEIEVLTKKEDYFFSLIKLIDKLI